MDGSSGHVTITRTLSADISETQSSAVGIHGEIFFGVSLANRGAVVVPIGHEQTYQRGPAGDPHTYGIPVALPQLNVLQNGNTMQADIGLPYSVLGLAGTNTGNDTSTITYKALIIGQNIDVPGQNPFECENYGDTYTWKYSHPSYSDSGDLPSLLYGYNISVVQQTYLYPQEFFKYEAQSVPVSIVPRDAGQTDNVDFSYTFIKDGAVADYHLKMNFHQPYENWVAGRSEPLPQTDTSLAKDWYPAKTSQSITPKDEELFAAFTTDVSGASTIASALAGKDPRVAAALAALGLIASANTPPPEIYSDTDGEFITAVAEARSGKDGGRFNDQQFLATITLDNMAEKHGECKWQPFMRTEWREDHWGCDVYGSAGYTGQDYAHLKRPYSQFPHSHYQVQRLSAPAAPFSSN